MKSLGSKKAVNILLGLILLFSFATKIYKVWLPERYYFDEVYHAVTAKLYARNDPKGYEWGHDKPEPNTAIEWLHPPLAKLTQAGGILIFGENSFGWRISSVLFGVGVTWATFMVAYEFTKSRKVALLAAFLVSIDGLILAQSRIAMNDIHVTFFILLSVLFYAKWKASPPKISLLLLTGLFTGLAMASKWSGVFLLGIFGLDQLISLIAKFIKNKKLPSFDLLSNFFICFVSLPLLIYFLSFAQFFIQGHSWRQFETLHYKILNYQTTLKATHPRQSTPIQWALDARPVWMYTASPSEETTKNIYNLGNPFIFWGGLLALLWLTYKIVKTKNNNYLLLLFAYLLVWTPWLLSPRIMFFYHYTPAVPFLVIILAIGLVSLISSKIKIFKYVVYFFVFLCFLWFLVFYPHLTGLPVAKSFAEKVYFIIPSWK